MQLILSIYIYIYFTFKVFALFSFYEPICSFEIHNLPLIGLQVAMATAAKAKLLLRELKTVKADLAFAKERCAQLEEENKLLRENREKGDHRADDDLVFLLRLFQSFK
jgi:hypothetical protein